MQSAADLDCTTEYVVHIESVRAERRVSVIIKLRLIDESMVVVRFYGRR